MKYIFNINDDIKVKLNDNGYQRLADLHNEFFGIIPQWVNLTADYFKNLADKDGYTTMPMWRFVKEFGEVTTISGPSYYDIEIIIDDKDLQCDYT